MSVIANPSDIASPAAEETALTWALSYATAGFPVFPVWHVVEPAPADVVAAFKAGTIPKREAVVQARCGCGNTECTSPGKHPIIGNGVNGASLDASTIRRWWTENPHAFLGIRMPTGTFALDFDTYVPGVQARLDSLRPDLPATLEQESGAGGVHLIFSGAPEDFLFSTTLDGERGIDVIHNSHRYLVAAPSGHWTGGTYSWASEFDAAPAPKWLLERCARGPKKAASKRPAAKTQTASATAGRYSSVKVQPPRVRLQCPANTQPTDWAVHLAKTLPPAISDDEEGSTEHGHVTLKRAAGHLIAGLGLEPEEAIAVLWEHYNPRCVPPWDADADGADGYDDFARTVRSAGEGLEPGYLLKKAAEPANDAGAGCEADLPRIVTRDGLCWIRREETNVYDQPLRARDLGVRLVNVGLDRALMLPRRGTSIDIGATLEEHARVAMHLERDFTTGGIAWHGERETLVEGYSLPTIEPAFDLEVEAWLRALAGGDVAELCDWIAGCRQDRLTQPGAALALVGDPDVGKSLFAGALARLWGCIRAVPLKATVAQFDGAKTECPIWFDDECEAIKAEVVTSDNFRELLQAREHFYERKNQEKRRLRGCARVVLACNEPTDIRFADVAGPGAVQAIVDRLALFVVPREQTDGVRAALAQLRQPGQQDVDVGRIVAHMAWIQETTAPRLQRFLGARSNVKDARRAAYAGVTSRAAVMFEVLREHLEGTLPTPKPYQAGEPPCLKREADRLWALPSALAKRCAAVDVRFDLTAVQRALEPFRAGERKSLRCGKGESSKAYWYWPLDEEGLRCALGM